MTKKQEILKRFHQKYDFSENKTLEYDNLVGIADFISDSLDEYRDEVVEMLQDRKKVLEELYSRHKLDIDEHRINEVERTITKLKEEK
jgi:transcription termination factor NusB